MDHQTSDTFAVGETVHHRRFGEGVIDQLIRADCDLDGHGGSGAALTATVAFASGNRRRVSLFHLGREPFPPEPPPISIAARKAGIHATPFVLRAPAEIPRRRFLYGTHYARQFISTTIAPGGIGKSSLTIVEALAMATGRALLGVKPREQCRVWIWNGEDPHEEIERRIAAACLHYGLTARDIEGQLFVNSGRDTEIIMAVTDRSGFVLAHPVREALVATMRERGIDVMMIDPLVASHRVPENDNGAIDAVMKAWAKVAGEANAALEFVHHSRKTGGGEVSVEDGRGAVALIAAARSARALNGMSKDEAEAAGVDNHRLYFRSLNGKANMGPPPDKSDWYRLLPVSLENGNDPLDPGDSVAVVTAWEWPSPTSDITAAHYEAAARAVRSGKWRESSQSPDWVGRAIAEALGLDLDNGADKAKVRACLKMWLASGAFRVVEGLDEKRNTRKFVEVSDDG